MASPGLTVTLRIADGDLFADLAFTLHALAARAHERHRDEASRHFGSTAFAKYFRDCREEHCREAADVLNRYYNRLAGKLTAYLHAADQA